MDKANTMDNCYKGNNQGQPRMKYRRGQRKDVCCYNWTEWWHYSRDCLLPKRTRKEQRSWGFEVKFKRIFWKVIKENNSKPEDFAAEEILFVVKMWNQEKIIPFLQNRVNNLNDKKRKTSFTQFKVKQRNIFRLVLIDTGNLVHSAKVSGSSGKR